MIDNKAADKLICDIAGGDMSALETLYRGLAPGVFAFARSIVRDDALAQDIMQDTFVRVYNSAGSFRPRGLGKAWVMQIARNLALDALTRRTAAEPEEVIGERPAGDSTEDSAEARVMIGHALSVLTDAEREVIVLHYLQNLSAEELGEIVGLSASAVYRRLAKAKEMLRELLKGWENDG